MSIDTDTPILPYAVARSATQDLGYYLWTQHQLTMPDQDGLEDTLVAHAEAYYANRPEVRRRWKRNPDSGLDWLHCFMRHWLAAECFRRWPQTRQMIPDRFCNGESLIQQAREVQ